MQFSAVEPGKDMLLVPDGVAQWKSALCHCAFVCVDVFARRYHLMCDGVLGSHHRQCPGQGGHEAAGLGRGYPGRITESGERLSPVGLPQKHPDTQRLFSHPTHLNILYF